VCVCVDGGRGVRQHIQKNCLFVKEIIIIVICAHPTLVAPAIAAGVVAEVSCLLTHLPFLLLSANGSMYHIVFNTRCNRLQQTATDCNRLQYTYPHCNVLHQTSPHCNTMQHLIRSLDVLPRNILQHTATHCNTLQHTTPRCNKVHHTASHRNTLQHITTLGTLPR